MESTEKLLIGRCALVALGSFNPAIFQPEWFQNHSIVSEEEVAGIATEVTKKEIPEIGLTIEFGQRFMVTNDQAVINFKSFKIDAGREKVAVVADDERAFSLIVSVFRKIFKILPETPVKAYGINFMGNYKFKHDYSTLFNKFMTKTSTLTDLFGEDNLCGFKLKTKKLNSLMTFEMMKSKEKDTDVVIKTNFHYDLGGQGLDIMIKDFKTHFGDSKDFFMKILENYSS